MINVSTNLAFALATAAVIATLLMLAYRERKLNDTNVRLRGKVLVIFLIGVLLLIGWGIAIYLDL